MSESSSAWISSERSGVSRCAEPSMCELEGDAVLVELAELRQRHHLEAAGVGQDRPRPVGEGVQAAERRHPLGARPQHQVIGVAEDDVGAGRPHLIQVIAFTVPAVPTGMKAGVRTTPRGSVDRAGPRRAVGRVDAEGRRRGVIAPRLRIEQARIAIRIEPVAAARSHGA